MRKKNASKVKRPRKLGLNRILSKFGYCSRSKAAELIRQGRVRVNSSVCRDSEKPISEKDRIEVDGKAVASARKIYLMLNKPRGIVTTASDEKGRPTVYALLDNGSSWVAPVGRLDKASEGLLLLTNDSEWAARISSPKSHLEKTYHVHIGTIADSQLMEATRRGVRPGEQVLKAKRVRLLRHGQKNSWIEIVLDEGKNRHIRRLLAELNVPVLRLIRVSIGSVSLGTLAKGKSRPLTREERDLLNGPSAAKTFWS